MLGAIDSRSDFILAADKFRRSFAPDFELPERFQYGSAPGKTAGSGDGPDRAAEAGSANEKTASPGRSGAPDPLSGEPEHGKSDSSGGASTAGVQPDRPDASTPDKSASTGGSFTKDRALARQSALVEKLKGALKGELVPDDDDDDPGEATRPNGDSGAGLGDEAYRNAVMQYERKAGREPKLGDPHQTGWDIRSADPQTGEIRLIEVKGKGCPWVATRSWS